MKKLPIAKTTFHKLINENCLYVDKTMYIKQMLDEGNCYWFLSRPRRFGKSLFLDTIHAAFACKRDLFKGLYIEKNWDWTISYPVIAISLGGSSVSNKQELSIHLKTLLKESAEKYNLTLSNELIGDCFRELIIKLKKKYSLGVVVLIDEYDKPLLDNITKEKADEIREFLAGFYSVLKDADEYLKFVFLTGVSKFSKTSIFSKLNNLTDISLSKRYADICGYTQEEFELVFKDYLKGEDLKKIKLWYDGYNFLGKNVYNPFDILLFLREKEFKTYWFETGTPTFLLKLIKKQKYYLPKLSHINLTLSQLGEFDINHIGIETLLYQTGYLTIEKEVTSLPFKEYKMKIPNLEVNFGFNDYLLRSFFSPGLQPTEQVKLYNNIQSALLNNKPYKLEQAFFSFFASVPHDWYRKNNIADYEGYYCSVFYTYFNALGLNIIPEDVTNTGKIDFTVNTEKAVYIFEIKLKKKQNTKSNSVLQQIKEKKYYEKYKNNKKEIYLIGIEFDTEKKNISYFECERYST